jgi:hypothetical protein
MTYKKIEAEKEKMGGWGWGDLMNLLLSPSPHSFREAPLKPALKKCLCPSAAYISTCMNID